MIVDDFRRLQALPIEIERQRLKLQRMRAAAGVKSLKFEGMPHGSGVYDKIGELVPGIVDIEDRITECEKEYIELKERVEHWINDLPVEDIKAQYFLTMRYIEGYRWEEIADSCSDCEGITSGSAVRMYCQRYLKDHGC